MPYRQTGARPVHLRVSGGLLVPFLFFAFKLGPSPRERRFDKHLLERLKLIRSISA